MAKLYWIKVKNGAITLEEVPEKWRKEVQDLLDADIEL